MIKVLDHGFVRLVSYTQPVPIEVDTPSGDALAQPFGWTADLEIVRNARTSYNADWRTGEDEGKDEKLINYLWQHGHTTPFEAVSFTFEVQAPIFVLRQWHRHRTWTYNEVSARYTELPELFYVPKAEYVGRQSKTNKQGREMLSDGIAEADWFVADLEEHSVEALNEYREQLKYGIPRELARLFLPVNVYSRMFASVNLLNLFRFLKLRLHSHAQYEIRVYAEALLKLVEPIAPVACKAFEAELSKEYYE